MFSIKKTAEVLATYKKQTIKNYYSNNLKNFQL